MNNWQPAYALIPRLGGAYSVVFHTISGGSNSHLGYGSFPRSKYPRLPVLDFRNIDDETSNKVGRWSDTHRIKETELTYWNDTRKVVSLEDFLIMMDVLGIPRLTA